jgi:nucleoside 2-deoxyribosyltransferase
MGFKVFSPIHDVGVGCAELVAGKDIEALEKAQVILAILDGLDPGTIFEIGFAKAKGIKVIVVAESVPEESLTMVSGTECSVFDDLTSAIYAACWETMKNV